MDSLGTLSVDRKRPNEAEDYADRRESAVKRRSNQLKKLGSLDDLRMDYDSLLKSPTGQKVTIDDYRASQAWDKKWSYSFQIISKK